MVTTNESVGHLAQARHAMHAAVQIPAAAAHALSPHEADFAHTTLRYDESLGALVGAPLGEGASVRLAVRFSDLALLVLSPTGPHTVESRGRTLEELRAEVASTLATHGLSSDLPWLSHDLPRHALHDGGRFDLPEGLDVLESWFVRAQSALRAVAETRETTPIRCWPHHFDTALLILLDPSGGEEARSIGVGLSPGDAHLVDPYWYVSPWPPPSGPLPALEMGRWHTDGFTAAVLQTRGPEVDRFLADAIAASEARLK